MSESSESSNEKSSYAKSSSWKIDLASFSKTRIKLETMINDSQTCGEVMQAYFDSRHTAFTKLPWTNDRPEYGIFPLQKFFYEPCKKTDKGAVTALQGKTYVRLTKEGEAFADELKNKHKEYFERHKYIWGKTEGTCLPTYDAMLFWPKKSMDAFRMFGDFVGAGGDSSKLKTMTPREFKKLVKKCRKWLRANQRIWSKIVSHLSLASIHVTDDIETSNGIILLTKFISKFDHSASSSPGTRG